MGRKKKDKNETHTTQSEKLQLGEVLHSDAKRSIVAVFLFALTLLFLFSFIGVAGVFGLWLNKTLGVMLGVGKWFLLLVLAVAALMLLRRRSTTLADVVKCVGLSVSLCALLGLLHLFSADSTEAMRTVAQAGKGGGYVGFGIASVLGGFMGKIAGTLVAVALFVIGMIAAFNMSLIHAFEKIHARLRRDEAMPTDKEMQNNSAPETVIPSAQPLLSSPLADEAVVPEAVAPLQAEELAKHNIGKIDFPDEAPLIAPSLEHEEEAVLVPAFIRPKKSGVRKLAWELPSADLLESSTGQAIGGDTERNKHIIQSTLKHFGIEVEPGEVRIGPTVTQYTFRPAFGVKLSRITTLNSDLALALAAKSVRIEAPIPGQALIGIEVPNQSVATVRLKAVFECDEWKNRRSDLMMVLGQDVAGKYVLADLAKMPHVLIAGRTGSGKSVCMNTLLLSLLYQNSPDDMQLILVDPKRVSFARYKGIPHLRSEVVMENKKVLNVLRWAAGQMDYRYKLLEEAGVDDIRKYRSLVENGAKRRHVEAETGRVTETPYPAMPYIIIMIDEMADLMVTQGKEVEGVVVRLASLARAVGIHLILATQRPEATVITGLIKANIPARISFQLRSHIDSRTIIDASGAEKLLGNGDMLYAAADGKEMRRIQGVLVSDDEVNRVTSFLVKQKQERGEDSIGEDFGESKDGETLTDALNALDDGSKSDTLYEEVKRLVVQTGRASTTNLQTTFGIGYPRAARLMHLLEENGVIGMVDGKKKVLLTDTSSSEEGSAEAPPKYGDDPVADQAEREKWQVT